MCCLSWRWHVMGNSGDTFPQIWTWAVYTNTQDAFQHALLIWDQWPSIWWIGSLRLGVGHLRKFCHQWHHLDCFHGHFITLFLFLFFILTVTVPTFHFHCMEKSSLDFLTNFSFCLVYGCTSFGTCVILLSFIYYYSFLLMFIKLDFIFRFNIIILVIF